MELYLLGRKLMKLGEEALPPTRFRQLPGSVRSVLMDIFEHPGTSVTEITARTGFPQSAVSAAVSRLREAGGVVTVTDPADRRRTLVSPNPEVRRRIPALPWVPVDEVLAQAVGPDGAAEAVAALELLARLLGVDPMRWARTQAGPS